jgi:hypothetical protein
MVQTFCREGTLMKNPFRFWMTGGAAMIFAALSGGRALGAEERAQLTRVSRYGLEETVSRLRASALRHGLPMMARLQPHTHSEHYRPSRFILVLESSQGGTPVSMDDPNGRPALLLSLIVQMGEGGTTEVVLPEGAFDDLPEAMSAEVRHDLEDLPVVVEEALAEEAVMA